MNDLIKCFYCNALFDPSVSWITGFVKTNDTSSTGFVSVSEPCNYYQKEGRCPLCKRIIK